MYKSFKDPIYGYIKIDKDIVSNIIDTAEFQRLRNVIQTSYAPLYSSAVHNRFVHSLGVYHLGKIVTDTIREGITEEFSKIADRYLYLYELACLLHDVGHAPFSHTGEACYLNQGSREELHQLIIDETRDGNLKEEIASKDYKAAPHELMSIIVALKTFSGLFDSDEERSFFARCISGYGYVKSYDSWHSFLNCLISLLNSSVIDVDKLDYLIRDAYITGFDTINIDYIRLLKSVTLEKCTDTQSGATKYEIIYSKNAISVIENVVYAHDAERKWIQNHPVVQYEGYLLKNIMNSLNRKYGDSNIFSLESLSFEGKDLNEQFHIALLSDSDILFLMKNVEMTNDIKEYFFRMERRHPIWKSESEYKAYFGPYFTDVTFPILDSEMEQLIKYVNSLGLSSVLNEKALRACNEDLEKFRKLPEATSNSYYVQLIHQKEKRKEWLLAFKEFAEEQGIEFEFVLVQANQFNSGFSKDGFGNLQICFPNITKPVLFKNVTNALTANKSIGDKFFYLFYNRADDKKQINVYSLVDKLEILVKKETR